MKIFAVLSILVSACFSVEAIGSDFQYKINPLSASPEIIVIHDKNIQAVSGGGFKAFDVKTSSQIEFGKGEFTSQNGLSSYSCDSNNLKIQAQFSSKADHVLVTGTLTNTRDAQRAIILSYSIPLPGNLFTSMEPDTSVPAATKAETNVYPIAAIYDPNQKYGIAMAIPPSSPSIFGMTTGPRGLGINLYIGLEPANSKTNTVASFSFLIYPVDPSWAFRSAMEKYYKFYPDYYEKRVKRDGLWMFEMEGITPSNLSDYAFDEIDMGSKEVSKTMERDEKAGILTFPYMIVGQREIKFLDELPKSYEEAMLAFNKWHVPVNGKIIKENAATRGDVLLSDEVKTSACRKANGEYTIVIRNTLWGKNSVTFKVNPSPYLAQNEKYKKGCVGANALSLIDQWLKDYPQSDGIYIDSLGPAWIGTLNYNQGHFEYARHPLTFDKEGRLALHNELSHYEFLDSLRTTLRSKNKLLFGNGVYCYSTKGKEHYSASKLGRFFEASLLDIASNEAGVALGQDRWDFYRFSMGPKIYTLLNYYWQDQAKVEKYVNKALCYGVFATNNRALDGTSLVDGTSYADNPDGYIRDKKLIEWFVPNVRMLSQAGWEPVTHAKVNAKDIRCERFGKGEIIYFTLLNENPDAIEAVLDIDLNSLGFTPDDAAIEEVAREQKIKVEKNSVKIKLDPYATCILKVSKSWIAG